MARRVPALLNYTAGAERVASACVAAGVRTLVTSRRFVAVAQLESALSALGNVRIVYVEDLRASLTLRDKLWLLGRAVP